MSDANDEVVLYGLTACDTCKKARNWLKRHEVAHRFVDYREQRATPEQLKFWAQQVGGFDKLINRAGTTWRNLPVARRDPRTPPEWTLLLKEHPTLVRRPVVVIGERVSLGFSDKLFATLFPR